MSNAIDPQRLPLLRDLNAALRAFAQADYDLTNEILEPYQGDTDKELELTGELIEVVSSLLSTAADSGLPPRDLLEHLVKDVPPDKTAVYRRVAALILAVHEHAPKEMQDLHMRSGTAHEAVVKALLNTGVWLTRQLAKQLGVTEDAIYDSVALNLAAE